MDVRIMKSVSTPRGIAAGGKGDLRMADGLGEWIAELGRNPNPDSADVHQNTWSSLSPISESRECGLDGAELDAARALACFSRTAVLESSGKRRKRHKNGTRAMDTEYSIEGRDLTFAPEENQGIKVTQEHEINPEQVIERPPPTTSCSSNYLSTSSGRKMWQKLTQAEREARRMHRVLANRESARQTIRRRQALREELMKKASELSLDNHNMKMEKEQIMKECMLLKSKNKQLKDEVKKIKASSGKIHAMAMDCIIEGADVTSTSSSFRHEHPFLGSINPSFIPGTLPSCPIIAAHVGLFYGDGDSHKAAGPQALLYVQPCRRFYSLLHRMSASCHRMPDTWKDEDVNPKAMAAEHRSYMKEQDHAENCPTDEEEAPRVKHCNLDIDLNFRSEAFSPYSDALNRCSSSRDEPGDEPGRNAPDLITVNKTEQSCTFLDASAARRRRKEIMKLKHLCGRAVGTH